MYIKIIMGNSTVSAVAWRVKKKLTPPLGRTKHNHIFLVYWDVWSRKWMVVKKNIGDNIFFGHDLCFGGSAILSVAQNHKNGC